MKQRDIYTKIYRYKYKDTETERPRYRDTDIQPYRDTEIQRLYVDTEKWNTERCPDKMSGDITSVGQNVRRDKMSGGTKHPETKHPFGLFSINSSYIGFFLTQGISIIHQVQCIFIMS